ncbi:MAG: glutaryl-CoA dehydrogenase [Octadecabacter sp.]|jgi:glutaryl-CoA dehydrogenase
MIERNNCGKALEISLNVPDMHGQNCISQDFLVVRHMINLETINTYDSTHDIHALILGLAQISLQAF